MVNVFTTDRQIEKRELVATFNMIETLEGRGKAVFVRENA